MEKRLQKRRQLSHRSSPNSFFAVASCTFATSSSCESEDMHHEDAKTRRTAKKTVVVAEWLRPIRMIPKANEERKQKRPASETHAGPKGHGRHCAKRLRRGAGGA